MNRIRVKEIFSVPSSDLLSAADKQLALSNAIGFAADMAFDRCLISKGSGAFGTGATLAGFAARGLNLLWKQSLIGRLPLAESRPALRRASSPWAFAAAHGAAWALDLAKEETAAFVGWGICQAPPLSSAALVAHHALWKLKACLIQWRARPWDAAKGVAVHGFNLGCEAMRVFSTWNYSGWEAWGRQKECYAAEGSEGFLFAHEMVGGVRKLAASRAESKQCLGDYLDRVGKMAGEFKQSMRNAQGPEALFQAGSEGDIAAIVSMRTNEAKMSWQDFFAAKKAFDKAVFRMNREWAKQWKGWAKAISDPFTLEPRSFTEIGPLLERKQEIGGICNETLHPLSQASKEFDRREFTHLSSSRPKLEIDRRLEGVEALCVQAQEGLNAEIQEKMDQLIEPWLQELQMMPSSLGKGWLKNAPASGLYDSFKKGEAAIRMRCDQFAGQIQELFQKSRDQTASGWVAKVRRYGEERIAELEQMWEVAYQVREEEIWFWTKIRLWLKGAIPKERPELKARILAQKILRIDLNADPVGGALKLLSLENSLHFIPVRQAVIRGSALIHAIQGAPDGDRARKAIKKAVENLR